ncbi:VWA domain-containing protein [Streptomyces sp. NPDC055092]
MPRVNVAIAMGVPGGNLNYMATDGVRYVVEMSQRYFDGPNAGIWLFLREPVRIPGPDAAGLAEWVDDWLSREGIVDSYRGIRKNNSVRGVLKKMRKSGVWDLNISPVLNEIIDATADLPGHTVAVVVLTDSPDDGAEFIATMKRAARYPVFWVFIGADDSQVARLGVVDTLGERPGDPDNFLILKTQTWTSEFGQWWMARRIRRAVSRWQRLTPIG